MARSPSQACFLHLILLYWTKHPIRNTNCNRYICYVLFYHCGLLCLAKCFLRGNETKPQPRLGTRGIDSFNASGSFSSYLSESFFVDCGEWGDCLSFWSILRLSVDVFKNIFRVLHYSCHCNNSEMLFAVALGCFKNVEVTEWNDLGSCYKEYNNPLFPFFMAPESNGQLYYYLQVIYFH